MTPRSKDKRKRPTSGKLKMMASGPHLGTLARAWLEFTGICGAPGSVLRVLSLYPFSGCQWRSPESPKILTATCSSPKSLMVKLRGDLRGLRQRGFNRVGVACVTQSAMNRTELELTVSTAN